MGKLRNEPKPEDCYYPVNQLDKPVLGPEPDEKRTQKMAGDRPFGEIKTASDQIQVNPTISALLRGMASLTFSEERIMGYNAGRCSSHPPSPPVKPALCP
jgi:hypothetical protein